MVFQFATEPIRRLAAGVLLGSVVALCAVLAPGASAGATGMNDSDAPRVGRVPYTRVAQLFGDELWDEMPEPRRDVPPPLPTYRTMCVRLCDGYYFPISFATPSARFGRDAESCESRCGTQARLFVYRNPGEQIEDMTDLDGRPYRGLPAAFHYRTRYEPGCKCQPQPWEAEARQRHEAYAVAAAVRRGDKQAVARAKLVPAVVSQPVQAVAAQSLANGRPAVVGKSGIGGRQQLARSERDGRRVPSARLRMTAREEPVWEQASLSRLGRKPPRRASRGETRVIAHSDGDWRKRAFQAN